MTALQSFLKPRQKSPLGLAPHRQAQWPYKILITLCAMLLLHTVLPNRSAAQQLTKEQQLNALKLQNQQLVVDQRYSSLASHKRELDSARQLHEQGFYSLQRYKTTLNAYKEAELNFEKAQIQLEQTKLDLLKDATHILLEDASKYKTDDGKSMVDVTLANVSNIQNALLIDPSLTQEEVRTLLKVENIYVSLNNGSAGVGEPYEILLPSLEVNERRTLVYRLLRDESAVVVDVKYLDLNDHKYVILKKGGQQELPSINSAQFSQSGELNQTVRFDMTLERLSDEERSFALAVMGLPQRIDYAFANQGAKVSQVKFDENNSKVRLTLELEIPEKLDRRFIGRTRTFFALVTEPSEYAQINTLKARFGDDAIPEKEIKGLKSNYVKLELIPKGIGKLEVLVANRYQEIKTGGELKILVEFLNRGTVSVQNIKTALDLPYEWESEVEPTLLKRLEPGERGPVTITARPPEDIAPGDYDLGIEAQGQVGTENIESLEKNITVRIGAQSNIAGNTILIGVLVLLVVGIGITSVKISRR